MATINKQLSIMETATFKLNTLNGTECYKESNGRFYHCFINNDASLNSNVRWYRITKEEYEYHKENSMYVA